MHHDRVKPSVRTRAALPFAVLLLALRAQTASAQREMSPVFGAITATSSFADAAPLDLAGRIVLDPSRQALGLWAAAGMRWAGLPARSVHPVGAAGVRLRQGTLRFALGLSRDIAYRSLEPDSAGSPPGMSTPPPFTSPPAGNGGWNAPTRSGYAMQPVADVVASTEWSPSRFRVALESGWRLTGPDHGRPWFNLGVATPVLPDLALIASADQRRTHAFSRAPVRLTLGFEWRSAPWKRPPRVRPEPVVNDAPLTRAVPAPAVSDHAFSIQRITDGIRLRFVTMTAREVEVRSDLTRWMPLALERVAPATWQIDLRASPGVHRLAIRTDGGPWLPPPGLPVGSDGYGARVGLLVIDR